MTKATMVGTAVAASGCAVITQPGSPVTFVTDCGGGSLCRDGYTEFCCVINDGLNACPPDSIPSGWWRADYSVYCNGTRYYIDCNNYTGAGPCRCGNGCGTRKVYCNHFRYGQCNTWQPGTGVIACRVVTCTPPYALNIGCDPSGAVDNATAGHYTDCTPYQPPPPPAVEVSLGTPVLVSPTALEVFVRGGAGTVEYLRGDLSLLSWDPWQVLGATVTSRVAAASAGDGQVCVVTRGSANQAFAQRFDGSQWLGWEPLGGSFTSDPAVAATSPGLVVVARGVDRAMYACRHDGSQWLSWQSLGGMLTSDPALAPLPGGGAFLVARGTDNALFTNSFDGTQWSGWSSLGGVFTSDPAAATSGAERTVVARGVDHALYVNRFDGSQWLGWDRLPGTFNSDPAVVMTASDVFVFARGAGNAMFANHLVGGVWAGWEALGGMFTSDPAGVALGAEAYVFGRGVDHALYVNRFDGSQWLGWQSLGGRVESVRGAAQP